MTRIFFAFFLFTATATIATTQHVAAQTVAVTAASFTVKVDQMDAYIASGNLTSAQTTFGEIDNMMQSVLATTKASIRSAATPADKTSAQNIMRNQFAIYQAIWKLKADLATNRAAIRTKLQEFDLTIQ